MKYVLSSFIFLIIAGCEPGFQVYVRNNSPTPLFVRTHPSIESIFPKFESYYDSIVARKVAEEDGSSLYKIDPFTGLMVWNNLGKGPTLNFIPFDHLALISGTDSIILDNEEKIFQFIKPGNKKFAYYIELPPE